MTTRKWLLLTAVIVVGALSYLGWKFFQPKELVKGFASSNGRIEAVENDVATKTEGRIMDVLVNEGDFIAAGQVLAHMDTEVLMAQLREAKAQLRQAKGAVGDCPEHCGIARKRKGGSAVRGIAARCRTRCHKKAFHPHGNPG